MTEGVPHPFDLVSTEALVRGHHHLEEALFTLLGAWSTDPGSSAGPAGREFQAFFATQSAFHGWRATQWELRRPRSVGPEADGAVPAVASVVGWEGALGVARGLRDGPSRLACWAGALQPSLAARYRGHERGLAPAADAGVARWLRMALGDVLEGLVDGTELLARSVPPAGAGAATAAVRDTLMPLLGVDRS